uniref:type ISP restriction/modification enzyme n=1 Tax=Microcystis sp. LSC13-02 TaxID=1895004 RepID=UPI0025795A6D
HFSIYLVNALVFNGKAVVERRGFRPKIFDDRAYWQNIPSRVWEYNIGGYQVIKKWLSYREEKLLGRGLTIAEVQEVSEMTRRITAIILLESDLDDNYQNIKTAVYSF